MSRLYKKRELKTLDARLLLEEFFVRTKYDSPEHDMIECSMYELLDELGRRIDASRGDGK